MAANRDGAFGPYQACSPKQSSTRLQKRSHKYTAKEWELHRPRIIQLYEEDGNSLPNVLEVMRQERNFTPTVRQCRFRLDKWGIRKNGQSNLGTEDHEDVASHTPLSYPDVHAAASHGTRNNHDDCLANDLEDAGSSFVPTEPDSRRPGMSNFEQLSMSSHAVQDMYSFPDPEGSSLRCVRVVNADRNQEFNQQAQVSPTAGTMPFDIPSETDVFGFADANDLRAQDAIASPSVSPLPHEELSARCGDLRSRLVCHHSSERYHEPHVLHLVGGHHNAAQDILDMVHQLIPPSGSGASTTRWRINTNLSFNPGAIANGALVLKRHSREFMREELTWSYVHIGRLFRLHQSQDFPYLLGPLTELVIVIRGTTQLEVYAPPMFRGDQDQYRICHVPLSNEYLYSQLQRHVDAEQADMLANSLALARSAMLGIVDAVNLM